MLVIIAGEAAKRGYVLRDGMEFIRDMAEVVKNSHFPFLSASESGDPCFSEFFDKITIFTFENHI